MIGWRFGVPSEGHAYAPTLLVQFNAANPPGVYGYHYRGTQSGVRVDLCFTFTGAT